jgi:hypothetical protein
MCAVGRGWESSGMADSASNALMTTHCALDHAVGRSAPCPESDCPFWEPGGAVLPGRCAFERLDLSRWPGVASELLQVREMLKPAVSAESEREARHRFHHLLNESEDA